MPGLESNPPQALWRLTILAGAFPPLEGFINRFCHWLTNFDKLERKQLWLNSCHCQLAHKDGLLQASHSVMLWPCDFITWSHLSSSNDIPLSQHPLTTLSLPTSHLILLLQNIALMRSVPACITSRFLQPSSNSNPYQHLLLGLDLSTSETIRESDYLTKPCNWGRHTKQNQPRMMLVRRT